jgi:2-keto-4-pentenoate hydratase/2-oxohepta-3-ene-1,7-dioic acid hydratase in catechol pathway
MAATVVTADEVLDHWTALRGHVRVNGETWCEGTTASAQHDLGDAVAYAAAGESLSAGDLLSSGALPGCCGLELGRFVAPGDVVRLEIEGIGTLTNRVGQR